MSDEEFNLADPEKGATVIAQWDGTTQDSRAKELHTHWSEDMNLSNARWVWIKFAKPSWIMSARVNKTNPECYPAEFAGYYSTDDGHQMISLFEERKIMLGKEDTFVERGIAPVYSDNILLVFPKFSNPDKPYLPKLEDIQVMGYFDE